MGSLGNTQIETKGKRNSEIPMLEEYIDSNKLAPQEKRFQQTFDKTYTDIVTLPDANFKSVNLNNPDEVTDEAKRLLIEQGITGQMSCYRVAGAVAAMLDKQGIPYECYVGQGYPENFQGKRSEASNHVWVKNLENNKIYEVFPNYEGQKIVYHKAKFILQK